MEITRDITLRINLEPAGTESLQAVNQTVETLSQITARVEAQRQQQVKKTTDIISENAGMLQKASDVVINNADHFKKAWEAAGEGIGAAVREAKTLEEMLRAAERIGDQVNIAGMATGDVASIDEAFKVQEGVTQAARDAWEERERLAKEFYRQLEEQRAMELEQERAAQAAEAAAFAKGLQERLEAEEAARKKRADDAEKWAAEIAAKEEAARLAHAKNLLEIREQIEANQKASREMWSRTAADIGQAGTAAAQFLTTIRFLAGENKTLEEFAREFAVMQATLQAMGQGQRVLQNLSEGLKSAGTAMTASAAASTLAATGNTAVHTTATVAAASTLKLARAATVAGTALQTAVPVVGTLVLAAGALKVAWDLMGGSAEESGNKIEDAMEASIAATERASDSAKSLMQSYESQSRLLDTIIKQKVALDGGESKESITMAAGKSKQDAIEKAKAEARAQFSRDSKSLAEFIASRRTSLQEELDRDFGDDPSKRDFVAKARVATARTEEEKQRAIKDRDRLASIRKELQGLKGLQQEAHATLNKSIQDGRISDQEANTLGSYLKRFDRQKGDESIRSYQDIANNQKSALGAAQVREHDSLKSLMERKDREREKLDREREAIQAKRDKEELDSLAIRRQAKTFEGQQGLEGLEIIGSDADIDDQRFELNEFMTAFRDLLPKGFTKDIGKRLTAGTLSEADLRNAVKDRSEFTDEERAEFDEQLAEKDEAIADLKSAVQDLTSLIKELAMDITEAKKQAEDAANANRN